MSGVTRALPYHDPVPPLPLRPYAQGLLADERDQTMRAYALMRQPEELEAIYARSPHYERARKEVDAIRAAVGGHLVFSYRGVGRYPFTEYAEIGPGWQWRAESAPTDDPEPEARALMLRFLGPEDQLTPYPRAFLDQIDHAKSVCAALRVTNCEIVELCTAPERPRQLLGFDVGYWGGGNFSILCDAAIWPLWHPPPSTALADLSRAIAELNTHGLFPSEYSATAFCDWYASQPWAEDEPQDFKAIAVGSVT